jgi:hypothetical protein
MLKPRFGLGFASGAWDCATATNGPISLLWPNSLRSLGLPETSPKLFWLLNQQFSCEPNSLSWYPNRLPSTSPLWFQTLASHPSRSHPPWGQSELAHSAPGRQAHTSNKNRDRTRPTLIGLCTGASRRRGRCTALLTAWPSETRTARIFQARANSGHMPGAAEMMGEAPPLGTLLAQGTVPWNPHTGRAPAGGGRTTMRRGLAAGSPGKLACSWHSKDGIRGRLLV